MAQNLSPNLQPIYDLELALGNTVVQVRESPDAALPLAIIFREPLHRREIESTLNIAAPVVWWSLGGFGGYVTEDTRQSLQGPMPDIIKVGQDARRRLSPRLQSIYDLELSLGNTLVGVDEATGWPLTITFKNPLHKNEIESTLSLPPVVKWWESRDPHYPVEGGYGCDETGHAVAGPLR